MKKQYRFEIVRRANGRYRLALRRARAQDGGACWPAAPATTAPRRRRGKRSTSCRRDHRRLRHDRRSIPVAGDELPDRPRRGAADGRGVPCRRRGGGVPPVPRPLQDTPGEWPIRPRRKRAKHGGSDGEAERRRRRASPQPARASRAKRNHRRRRRALGSAVTPPSRSETDAEARVDAWLEVLGAPDSAVQPVVRGLGAARRRSCGRATRARAGRGTG